MFICLQINICIEYIRFYYSCFEGQPLFFCNDHYIKHNYQKNPVVKPINHNSKARYIQKYHGDTSILGVTSKYLIGLKACSAGENSYLEL